MGAGKSTVGASWPRQRAGRSSTSTRPSPSKRARRCASSGRPAARSPTGSWNRRSCSTRWSGASGAVLAAPGGVVLDPAVRAGLVRSVRGVAAGGPGHARHDGSNTTTIGPCWVIDPREVLTHDGAGRARALRTRGRPRRRHRSPSTPATVAEIVLERSTGSHRPLNEGESRCCGHRTTRRGRRSDSTDSGTSRSIMAASGVTEGWWQGPLPDARPMPVPSSYNDVLVDPAVHDHVGDVWYQRTVFVPRGWDGRGGRCASTPPRTGPPCGSTTPSSPSTRAGTRRSRRTSPHWSGSGQELIRLTVVVNNELTGSRSLPASSRPCPTAGGASVSTTTSSTTPD